MGRDVGMGFIWAASAAVAFGSLAPSLTYILAVRYPHRQVLPDSRGFVQGSTGVASLPLDSSLVGSLAGEHGWSWLGVLSPS